MKEIEDVYLGHPPEDATWHLSVEEPNTFSSEPITLIHQESGREYTMYPNGEIEEEKTCHEY